MKKHFLSRRYCYYIPLRFLVFFLGCSLFVLFTHQENYADSIDTSNGGHDYKIVWSVNKHQGEQVYFSSYEKGRWTTPVQLSDSGDLAFHPTVSSGVDGRLWVVWTREDEKGSFLQFSTFNSSLWTKPRQIDTGMNNNKSATIVVDRNNSAWIAWTSVTEIYSDIYWSRWDGVQWAKPIKAHADNKVPDLNPILSLDDSGQIILSWQTFANGKYMTVSQKFDKKQWKNTSNVYRESLATKQKNLPHPPDFIKEFRKATISVKENGSSWSTPLSLLLDESLNQ
ncbi:MAG: hypothetical protein ABIJ50_04095 [Pseudomonadota bacterium]